MFINRLVSFSHLVDKKKLVVVGSKTCLRNKILGNNGSVFTTPNLTLQYTLTLLHRYGVIMSDPWHRTQRIVFNYMIHRLGFSPQSQDWSGTCPHLNFQEVQRSSKEHRSIGFVLNICHFYVTEDVEISCTNLSIESFLDASTALDLGFPPLYLRHDSVDVLQFVTSVPEHSAVLPHFIRRLAYIKTTCLNH